MARKFISRGTVREQFVEATFDHRSKQKRAIDTCIFAPFVHAHVYICVHTYMCVCVHLIHLPTNEERFFSKQWRHTVGTRETVSSRRSSCLQIAMSFLRSPNSVTLISPLSFSPLIRRGTDLMRGELCLPAISIGESPPKGGFLSEPHWRSDE